MVYFKPASVEYADSRLNAARIYKHILWNSIVKYIESRSYELDKSIKPKTESKINIGYSKEFILKFFTQDKFISEYVIAENSNKILPIWEKLS